MELSRRLKRPNSLPAKVNNNRGLVTVRRPGLELTCENENPHWSLSFRCLGLGIYPVVPGPLSGSHRQVFVEWGGGQAPEEIQVASQSFTLQASQAFNPDFFKRAFAGCIGSL